MLNDSTVMTAEQDASLQPLRSSFGTFSDPVAMAMAISGIAPETEQVRPVSRNVGDFHGMLSLAALDGLNVGVGRFTQGIPQTAWIGKVHTFMFATEPDIVRRVSGRWLGHNQIFHFRPDEQTVTASPPGTPWAFGIVTLPFTLLAEQVPQITGCDLDVPLDDDHMFAVPDAAMARLTALLFDTARLARDTPWIFRSSQSVSALSDTIIEALLLALTQGDVRQDRIGFTRHRKIVLRFEQVLRERPEDMLSLAAICAAVGVPQRTLSLACQDVLGQSPVHYARERRLHLIHQRLRAADPATTQVTDIAMHYGFWELGRFARAYRLRFGELPSETLRRNVQVERPAVRLI
jgi:AraC-like DNA-binding protein